MANTITVGDKFTIHNSCIVWTVTHILHNGIIASDACGERFFSYAFLARAATQVVTN